MQYLYVIMMKCYAAEKITFVPFVPFEFLPRSLSLSLSLSSHAKTEFSEIEISLYNFTDR